MEGRGGGARRRRGPGPAGWAGGRHPRTCLAKQVPVDAAQRTSAASSSARRPALAPPSPVQVLLPIWKDPVCGDGNCEWPWEFPSWGRFGCRAGPQGRVPSDCPARPATGMRALGTASLHAQLHHAAAPHHPPRPCRPCCPAPAPADCGLNANTTAIVVNVRADFTGHPTISARVLMNNAKWNLCLQDDARRKRGEADLCWWGGRTGAAGAGCLTGASPQAACGLAGTPTRGNRHRHTSPPAPPPPRYDADQTFSEVQVNAINAASVRRRRRRSTCAARQQPPGRLGAAAQPPACRVHPLATLASPLPRAGHRRAVVRHRQGRLRGAGQRRHLRHHQLLAAAAGEGAEGGGRRARHRAMGPVMGGWAAAVGAGG
jgi:hypothetical protein